MDLKNVYDTAKDIISPHLSTGEQLRAELGLDGFQHIWIRKIIDSSLSIYIIYVDSRYPNVYLPLKTVRDVRSTVIQKVKRNNPFVFNNFRMTPPIPLEDFDGGINKNSVIIRIDVTGDYFMDDKMYESTDYKYYEVTKTIEV